MKPMTDADTAASLFDEVTRLRSALERAAACVQSMTSACILVREIASPTMTAANGKRFEIRMSDGERGWVVHDDGMVALQAAEQAGVSTLAALAGK